MEKFNLPQLFQDKLEENTALSGVVKTSLGEFSPWLERNNIKFFTEYTDHGLRHIEEVLKEADDLIPEACRDNNFSAADAAVLTLATLLHDCAMHISVDGFIELVESDNRPIIPGFGDKPWKRLWLDFLAEARRFSGRKLMALYGNTEPIQHPPMDSQKMNGRDLLLIGEFLRRHHPRLAHEIALWGVPGPSSEKLKFKPMDDVKYIIDLAGIVARSHGMNMRDCADYLRINYGGEKIYKGVHTVFVMALLRIADILQIHSSRAPEQIEKVQKLQSPISLEEWEMHQSIEYVNKTHTDPETIFVVSHPKNVKTYLRIRELLDQIQKELDQSWTIIGETYTSMPQFRSIGLKYRRIKSNIDDLENFSQQVNYIPIQASFDVADTDLLKLLIGPLYGEKAEIGIRELLQNSLDAVIELQEYLRQNPKINFESPNIEGDVVISIDQKEDGGWWLTISDKGIGMTLSTVKDYFLKAGASLRRSEIWKKTFEDDEGKSKILRSGRFGIGALAAFLIGDEIKVTTRHISCSAEESIEFSSQLDTSAIEIRHTTAKVGTAITIKMNENAINSIISSEQKNNIESKWDWYCLNNPKVIRKFNGKELKQEHLLPALHSELYSGWQKINHPEYKEIYWSYLSFPQITCNGILVTGDTRSILSDKNFDFIRPSISVFDHNAKFPLNIQRTNLTTSLPFEKELIKSIIKDFIAYILIEAPTECTQQPENYFGHSDSESPWGFTDSGAIIFSEPKILEGLNRKSCLVVFQQKNASTTLQNLLPYGFPILNTVLDESNSRFENINNSISKGLGISILNLNIKNKTFPIALSHKYYNRNVESARLLISKKMLGDLLEFKKFFSDAIILDELMVKKVHFYKDTKALNKILMKGEPINLTPADFLGLGKYWENENWVIYSKGNQEKLSFDFEKFLNSDSIGEESLIAEWSFEEEDRDKNTESYFFQAWKELRLSQIIPYDKEERKKKFAYAYQELESNIENYLMTKDLLTKEKKILENLE